LIKSPANNDNDYLKARGNNPGIIVNQAYNTKQEASNFRQTNNISNANKNQKDSGVNYPQEKLFVIKK